jgi:hypothetical protein
MNESGTESRRVLPHVEVVRRPIVTTQGFVLLGAWLLISAFYSFATFETLRGPDALALPWFLAAGEILIALLMGLGSLATSVRRVELDPLGATFVYFFKRDRGLWKDLVPGAFPASQGVWVVSRRYASQESRTGYRYRRHYLSVNQGRA